jgi:hypothetical protein
LFISVDTQPIWLCVNTIFYRVSFVVAWLGGCCLLIVTFSFGLLLHSAATITPCDENSHPNSDALAMQRRQTMSSRPKSASSRNATSQIGIGASASVRLGAQPVWAESNARDITYMVHWVWCHCKAMMYVVVWGLELGQCEGQCEVWSSAR